MTVTHRKRAHQPDEIQTINEPGLQIECDACGTDLTHSVRMKCADAVCLPEDGVDICPKCFCEGKEFANHRRWHAYRVIELHSYPIFSEDWGADEELLLIEGISLQGLGNWQAIAEHVGTHTAEQVKEHYESIYINSSAWPLPPMHRHFDIDPSIFHERKRRRISAMDTTTPALPKVAPTSAPGVHEVATFLPGRLEFEHELDNDAEDLVKDLEFGVCLAWGGDQIPEDDADADVRARAKWIEERKSGIVAPTNANVNGFGVARGGKVPGKSGWPGGKMPGKWLPNVNGGSAVVSRSGSAVPEKDKKEKDEEGDDKDEEKDADEQTQPPPIETTESLAFKVTLMEMYRQRVEKRRENKQIMFDRGFLEYKKIQAAEKKRPKEEKDIIQRIKPFARLQTAADFEEFCTDILYESMLRKRIQELQHYRRMGLRSAADIEKYEADVVRRTTAKANIGMDFYTQQRHGSLRRSVDDDEMDGGTPKPAPPLRKPPAPLNLANSPCLHLLTPQEQTLCSSLRILPKPYLVIKETLVREYARRGGKLRRREARDLVKIDVNKTSRVWDFLVQAGFLRVNLDAASANGAAPSAPSSPTKPPPPPMPMQSTQSTGSTSTMPTPASTPSSHLPMAPATLPPVPAAVMGWQPGR